MAEPIISAEGVQPEDAMRYWQSKTPATPEEFEKMSDAAKSRAFVVSGIAKREMISEVHASLYQAIANGETLESWKARIPHIIKESGWSDSRLETIFRTNVSTAYMAGRYAQMQAVKKTRPYWQYVAVGDKRTRPEHAVLNGLVFHADNPFWDTHFPPNGFRCRCDVVTMSTRQLEKSGLPVQDKLQPTMIYTDPATGLQTQVSTAHTGGFDTNVGKDWLSGLTPSEEDAAAFKDIATQAVCKGPTDFATGPVCTPPLAKLDKKHILPIGPNDILAKNLPDTTYIREFMREFGLKTINDSKIITLPGVGSPLVISKQLFVDKPTGALKANKNDRGPYIKLLARTIKNPYEIWESPIERRPGKIETVLRLIRLFYGQEEEVGGFGVFTLRGSKWSGSTVFNPKPGNAALMLKYLEKQRVGTLIYREP